MKLKPKSPKLPTPKILELKTNVNVSKLEKPWRTNKLVKKVQMFEMVENDNFVYHL